MDSDLSASRARRLPVFRHRLHVRLDPVPPLAKRVHRRTRTRLAIHQPFRRFDIFGVRTLLSSQMRHFRRTFLRQGNRNRRRHGVLDTDDNRTLRLQQYRSFPNRTLNTFRIRRIFRIRTRTTPIHLIHSGHNNTTNTINSQTEGIYKPSQHTILTSNQRAVRPFGLLRHNTNARPSNGGLNLTLNCQALGTHQQHSSTTLRVVNNRLHEIRIHTRRRHFHRPR